MYYGYHKKTEIAFTTSFILLYIKFKQTQITVPKI